MQRKSEDGDFATQKQSDPAVFDKAGNDLLNVLPTLGYSIRLSSTNSYFRAYIITINSTNHEVKIDLGGDDRIRTPGIIIDGIYTLQKFDIIGGKMRAFYQRAYARDYYDVAHIYSLTNYRDVNILYRILKYILPEEAKKERFIELLSNYTSILYAELSPYGISIESFNTMMKLYKEILPLSKSIAEVSYRDGSASKPIPRRCIRCNVIMLEQQSIDDGIESECLAILNS